LLARIQLHLPLGLWSRLPCTHQVASWFSLPPSCHTVHVRSACLPWFCMLRADILVPVGQNYVCLHAQQILHEAAWHSFALLQASDSGGIGS
jgi:hypothetical protein